MPGNVHELRQVREPWDVAAHAAVAGARFVAPAEFLPAAREIVHQSVVKSVVVEALAEAADAQGVLLDFQPRRFFDIHVTRVLNNELDEGEQRPALAYDPFTAMALMDCLTSLALDEGLLANRGNGDSVDYRLTLP